jgi:hypothetical protein
MFDTAKIRELNDAFRRFFVGGRVLITQGVIALPDLDEIMRRVREFDAFNEDNDPYPHEHDFGAVEHGDAKIFWKLDYYSLNLLEGSPNPADEAVTARVLTVMLSSEY